jgi:phosphatidylglycerophosphate synthase
MRESAVLHRVKQGYTTGARSLASRSIVRLTRTRVTPNALTTCRRVALPAASVVVFFEYRSPWLFYWLGAFLFVVGSILDILDGALARAGGKTTPFGAFLDSTTDRVGEAAMLGAIALIFTATTTPLRWRWPLPVWPGRCWSATREPAQRRSG